MNAQDNDDYSRRSHCGKPVEGLTTARVWTMISKSKVKKKKKKITLCWGLLPGPARSYTGSGCFGPVTWGAWGVRERGG